MINAIAIHDELSNHSSQSVHEMPDTLMKACYLCGVDAYLFELEEICTYKREGYINAYRWTPKGYTACVTDMPKYSVYNFVVGVKSKVKSYYQWLVENTIMLNTAGIRKDLLQKKMLSTDLANYAIPSFVTRSYWETVDMLSLIPKAIIKPLGGSMGRGILKVNKNENGLYCQTPEGEYLFTESVFSAFESESGFQTNPQMLLEPCLNILTDDGRAVDLRCQTSLDRTGKWKNVLTYARIGASDVVSNISHGGSVTFAYEILEAFAPGHGKELLEEANWAARRTSEIVEELSGGAINCLGVDICYDRDSARLYVIEANAGPGFKIVGPWPLALARAEYFKYRLSQE